MHLVISNKPIRQDAQGRFCLNDLHKAAGGNRRHLPSRWMENLQTQELIAEIQGQGTETGIPVSLVRGGPAQGTWVCDDLVIAYANWISAKFYLRVIRCFKSQMGLELKESIGLMHLRLALEKRDETSKVRAQFGSGLMNDRRRELPSIRTERARLEAEMQQRLFAVAANAA